MSTSLELALNRMSAQEARSDTDVRAVLTLAVSADLKASPMPDVYYAYVLHVWGDDSNGKLVHSGPRGMVVERTYAMKKSKSGVSAELGPRVIGYLNATFEKADMRDVPESTDAVQEALSETHEIEIHEDASQSTASRVRVCLIKPGWGSMAFYPERVIKRDGPKVFVAGTHMYWNHDTAFEENARPVGDLDRLAAVLESDATWEKDGLYAYASVKQRFRTVLGDIWKDIGASINAFCTYKIGTQDGRTGRIAESIVAAKSVDFVTRAGAGGRIIELFESAVNQRTAIIPNKEKSMDKETQERFDALEKTMTGLASSFGSVNESLKASAGALHRLTLAQESACAVNAANVLHSVVNASALPEVSKKKLMESAFVGVQKDGVLDIVATRESATRLVVNEAEYLKAMGVSAKESAVNAGTADTGTPDVKKLTESFDASINAMLGKEVKK